MTDMALQGFPLLSIILWAAQVYALPTPCRLQGALIQKVSDLLESMGGLYPLECLGENVNLTFPVSAFTSNRTTAQVEDAVQQAVYEVLGSIDVVFEDDNTPPTWDQRKLDDFRHIVYRLVEENECVMKDHNSPNQETPIDTYFKEMTNVLQVKEHSTCAWEMVRTEVSRTLRFILKNASSHLFWTRAHRLHARA